MDQQNVTVSTKVDKDSDAKETVLSVDWDGITSQQLKAGYLAYMVVKVQGVWRKGGVIPSKISIKASEYAPGTRHTSTMTPEQALATVKSEALADKAKRAALIAELQAMA